MADVRHPKATHIPVHHQVSHPSKKSFATPAPTAQSKVSMQRTSRQPSHWWRTFLTCLLVFLASIAAVLMIATRYTKDTVLNTDRFVATVGPLPQNPQVSSALAQYTTKALFNAVDTEAALKNFLPPKLDPLAVPLAGELQKRTTDVTKQFIESDNFDSIWGASVRVLHTGVLKVADPDSPENQSDGAVTKATQAVANLDVSKLINSARGLLGDSSVLNETTANQADTIKIELLDSIAQLQWAVRMIKDGAYVLPYVYAALLLSAVAIAYNRRHAVIGVGLATLVMGAIMLVAFKVGSQEFLSAIQDATYRSAGAVVYEAFYGDLRHRIVLLMLGGGLITLGAVLAGPYPWAVWLRKAAYLPTLRKTKVYGLAAMLRHYVNKLRWWLIAAGALVMFAAMLLLTTLTIPTLIVIISVFVAYASFIYMLGTRSPYRRQQPL